MQIHACMLALHTGRPVRIAYNREESFYGHVHRHPCTMRYEHGATRDGRLVFVRARIVLDGGAYASSSTAVCANAACFACGPYEVPNARIDSYVVYTNNPPCGAMRGFGAVQVAFAHEAQMDRLAAALGMDPVDLRILNAMGPDSRMPTGQRVGEPAPVAELLERVRAMPMPPDGADGLPGRRRERDPRRGRAPGCRLRHRDQEHRLLGGLRRLLDRARAPVDRGRRAARRGPLGRGGGRPGHRHRAGPDRAHRAGRRARGGARRRHAGRLGGVDLGLAPDLRHRRRGQGRVRGGARAPGGAGGRARRDRGSGRRARGGRGDRGDHRVAPPPDAPASTRTARATRTCSTRSPRTARWSTSTPSWGSCAWSSWPPSQEVGQGHEPAGARGPDRGRQRAGARASRCSRRSRSSTARSSTRPSPTTCCRRSSTCRRCASRCSSTPTPRRPTASRASASRPTSRRRPPSPRRCAPPPAARCRASRCAPSTSSGSTPRRRFVARYGAIFEHSPWVARGAFAAAPSRASTTCTPRSWSPRCARRRASASSRSSAPTRSWPGARRRPAS